MTDYQIQPHTRRCCVTGRELQAGERYFTALVDDGAQLQRQDYAAESWQGPPQGAFSFWSGRVPATDDAKPRFDDDALEDCFHRLADDSEPGRINFRYVLALLLIRRKRFHFEQAVEQGGVETLEITNVRTGDRAFV